MFVSTEIKENVLLRSRFQEYLLYVFLWMLVLLFPLMNEATGSSRGMEFRWADVFQWWGRALPFLVVFLIHNHLLISKLLMNGRVKRYVLSVLLLLAVFGAYQYHDFEMRKDSLHSEHFHSRPPVPPRPPHHDAGRGLRVVPFPVSLNTFIAMMMSLFNLAIVLLFKYQRDQDRLKAMETARLQDELKYLKAQIKPHFFMNMLNNIHGLMERDAAKAQEMILELSKLMRYVLYEGKEKTVTLASEIEFVRCYITLMRQRYPEGKGVISVELPAESSDSQRLPPLLLIPFIENAFKHGISYYKQFSISVSLSVDRGMIIFHCINTLPQGREKTDGTGGVGLSNVRRRLDLLYGSGYTLNISKDEHEYRVALIIPDTI